MITAESSQASLAQERAAVQQRIEAQQQKLQNLTEEYRRQCEEITNTLRELHAQSNALAPVSRLAPELLSQIFLTHAATFHDNPQLRHRRRSLGWLSLLKVCRHWRQVAKATPPLWAHVLLAEKDYVEVALQRSGHTPLHLRSASPSTHLEDVYLAVQGERSRIRTLDLIVYSEAVRLLQKVDLTAVYAGMPMLEELHLVFYVHHQYDISSALVSLKMPRLRSLEIVDGPFSSTSSLARHTITRLEVRFRDGIALNSLLDVLDGMPLLQHLELHNLHKQLPRLPDIDPRTVRLQHLGYLHLDGEAHTFDLPCLLQCLAFPEGTRISFHPECLPMQFQETLNFEPRQFLLPIVFSQGFFSDIPGRSPSERCRPRVLALITNDFQLRLWGPSTSIHDLDNKAYLQQLPHLDVKLGARCALPESNPSFLGLLDLSALSVLDISPRAMSCDFWITTFRNHIPPNLERLYLSDTNLDNSGTLFEALGNLMMADARPTVDEDYDNGHAALSKRYILPGLQIIRLDGISTKYIRSRDVLQDLIAILHRRAKAGSKLKTLFFKYYRNSNDHSTQDYATLRDPSIYLAVEAVEIGE